MIARAAAVALTLALAAAGVQSWRLANEEAAHAETRREHAEHISGLERAARQATEAARAEEQRRTSRVQKAADEATRQLDRARADAVAAADAGQRLRQRLAELASSCHQAPSHSHAAGPSAPASSAADLLAHVQRRLDDATDRIAAHADAARAAGQACERSYDALSQ